MDIVTDLAAESVSYLLLFQDILRAQNKPDILTNLDRKTWKKLTIEDIAVDEDYLTPQQIEKIKVLVWHSPTREYEVSLPDKYFKTTLSLLNWISKKTKVDKYSDSKPPHNRVIFQTPFAWRALFRSVLYKNPEARLSLAEALNYMPLQIIKILADDNTSDDRIRLYQFYCSQNAPQDDFNVLSSMDMEIYSTWWYGKRKEVEILLCNDAELLQALKKRELPLPFETFFRDELIEITKVRHARSYEADTLYDTKNHLKEKSELDNSLEGKTFDPLEKAQSMHLVGIALSGGGIRSATFNLGILQRLASLNVLQSFDYISTVSGGGYIGTWLNSWIKRGGAFYKINDRLCPQKSSDPLADEVRPIRWLRMYSNYLTPYVGIMSSDAWTAGMTWVRNALINQSILLLILVTLLSGISLLFSLWISFEVYLSTTEVLTFQKAAWSSFCMLLIGVLMAGFAMGSFYKPKKPVKWNARFTLFAFQKSNLFSKNFFTSIIPSGIAIWGGICAIILGAYIASQNDTITNQSKIFEITASVGFSTFIALLLLATQGNYHKRFDLIHNGQNNVVSPKPYTRKTRDWPVWAGIIISSFIAAVTFASLLFFCCIYVCKAKEYFINNDLSAEKMGLVIGVPIILEIFSMAVIVRMVIMGKLFPDYRREWWGRLGGIVHRGMLLWITISFSALVVPELFLKISKYFATTKLPELSEWISILGWSGWLSVVGWGVTKAYEARNQLSKNQDFTDKLLKTVPIIFMIGFCYLQPGSWVKLTKFRW